MAITKIKTDNVLKHKFENGKNHNLNREGNEIEIISSDKYKTLSKNSCKGY